MNRSIMEPFLIRVAIPKVTDKKKLPHDLKESNWIWDAVYRAHRDVLTGRRYVKTYSNEHDQNEGAKEPGLNKIAVSLYDMLINYPNNEPICSIKLIKKLKQQYANVSIGAIQKLVNMSLKYLVILQTYGVINTIVNENNCDCPLDSIILSTLENYRSVKWTTIDSIEEYLEIQGAIKKRCELQCALKYDFHYWQQM